MRAIISKSGLVILVVFLMVALVGLSCSKEKAADEEKPSIESKQAAAEGEESAEQAGVEGTAAEWTCPMHPEVRSDEPGVCPTCKMDLVPVKDDDKGTTK